MMQMKAVIRTGLLSSQFFLSDNEPKPTFEPNSTIYPTSVLLQVSAAAINPIDYKLPKLIAGPIIGYDVSGTIVQVGSEVDSNNFQIGDEVYGACSLSQKNSGSLAEYCIVDVSAIAKRSKSMDDNGWTMAECASLNIAYVTSLQSLRLGNVTHESDNTNKAVLVIGASGGCGIAGLQLCRAMGVSRIVAICSGRNAEFVRSAAGMKDGEEKGSIQVVDYTNAKELELFFKENEGKFDCVLDAATGSGKGEDYWSSSVPLLKKVQKDGDVTGKFVALNGPPSKWVRALIGRQLEDQVICMCQSNTEDLELLPVLLDRIDVKPTLVRMPFTDQGLKDGFDMLKGRRTKGKIVFDIKK